jgi:hypothetical protein
MSLSAVKTAQISGFSLVQLFDKMQSFAGSIGTRAKTAYRTELP